MGTRLRAALLGGAVAVAAFPATASAEGRTCRGTIGATTVNNVRVPQGAACTLSGTRVKGTIKVERGSVLDARGVRVIGNVQGKNASKVTVRASSRIGGSVQVVQGGRANVLSSFVNGDILFDEIRGGWRSATTSWAEASRRSRPAAGSRSRVTGSTGTSSARRTRDGRSAAATSFRTTRRISARRL
jgi:hypothetical protein